MSFNDKTETSLRGKSAISWNKVVKVDNYKIGKSSLLVLV